MQDEEALRRCLDGDDGAFRVLYERYYPVLYGTAYLMTRDSALSHDLVHDAFFSAWKGLRGFRRESPFRPWLVRILVNRVLAHHRKFAPVTVPLLPEAPVAAGGGSDPVGDRVAVEDAARRLLEALPDDDSRQVVLLRYYGELSIQEIAEALGVPEGTVKSRLHRAMTMLKQIAGREGDPVGGD